MFAKIGAVIGAVVAVIVLLINREIDWSAAYRQYEHMTSATVLKLEPAKNGVWVVLDTPWRYATRALLTFEQAAELEVGQRISWIRAQTDKRAPRDSYIINWWLGATSQNLGLS